MALHKFIIPPDQDGYGFNDGLETLSVSLDGGASKFRRDVLNSNTRLSVQWTLSPENYEYIRCFYREFIESGSLPFLMDLYLDSSSALTEHECHFIPGTFGLRSQRGYTFTVGATIEAKPIEIPQSELDKYALYSLFGEEWAYNEDLFDNIINIQIPADYV